MDQVDEYSYFTLGAALTKLEETRTEPVKFSRIFLALINADFAIDEFDRSPTIHSKAAARDIKSAIQDLFAKVRIEKEDGKREIDFNVEIEPWQFGDLERAIKDFKSNFARESPTLPIFFIPPKGIYKTDDLINCAENMFSDKIRAVIPQQAITDVHEAGRCVAFELPTAAGFHVLRATEALTRNYYHFVTNAESGKTDWGKLIEELRRQTKADKGLLDLLDQIREERNTVMHPRRNLNMDEAIAVVSLAQAAISRTAIDMMNKGPQQN